jgi:pimeloyl-ACP methyl ester carboxylesterase
VPLIQTSLGALEGPHTPPFLGRVASSPDRWMPARVLVDTMCYRSAGDGVSSLRAAGEIYLARRQCPVPAVHADPSRASVETVLFADAPSRAIAWSGAGHRLHQERPDEFNALVSSWLAALSEI